MTTEAERQKLVVEEDRIVTARISESCRYISFGLLALYYAARTSQTGFMFDMYKQHPKALSAMAACAFLSILIDYWQYAAKSFSVGKAYGNKYNYDPDWCSYKLANAFFWLKQIAVCTAAVIIVGLVVYTSWPSIMTPPTPPVLPKG